MANPGPSNAHFYFAVAEPRPHRERDRSMPECSVVGPQHLQVVHHPALSSDGLRLDAGAPISGSQSLRRIPSYRFLGRGRPTPLRGLEPDFAEGVAPDRVTAAVTFRSPDRERQRREHAA
jgi:hypothetical protein